MYACLKNLRAQITFFLRLIAVLPYTDTRIIAVTLRITFFFILLFYAQPMHQTVKTIFRIFFASIIFIITAALILTCVTKTQEIFNAQKNFVNAEKISLHSTPQKPLVLVSNNQKPDQKLVVLIANNGYIAQLNCENYANLCTTQYNLSHTRQIQTINLVKAGQFFYIQHVNYRDSRTGQTSTFDYSDAQIQNFYENDVSSLKYIVFGIALFAAAAIFVSQRILRNFRRFLSK